MAIKNKPSKPRKKKMKLPIEFDNYQTPIEIYPIRTILDNIELPADLINGYKELNEKLEETILRIERKRRGRKNGRGTSVGTR